MKREHPTWGAGLIRLELAEQHPEFCLPHGRTLQVWFRKAGVHTPRTRRPAVSAERARAPHAVWQLDGKEGIRLADGTCSVLLDMVDEATGAVMAAAIFPPQSGVQATGTPRANVAPSGLSKVGIAGNAPGG